VEIFRQFICNKLGFRDLIAINKIKTQKAHKEYKDHKKPTFYYFNNKKIGPKKAADIRKEKETKKYKYFCIICLKYIIDFY
jgi:hypothetical protein